MANKQKVQAKTQEQTYEEIEQARQEQDHKRQRMIDLTWKLTSPTSELGDYKAIKCVTAFALGKTMPYDLEELEKKRQEVRDEIDALRKELGEE